MSNAETVRYWQDHVSDPELSAELEGLVSSGDEQAVEDAFFQELVFGTGGLRGIIGPGPNRMNIYTVGKATQGLADYLNSLEGGMKSVAIAHDSRINSELFCRTTACVLAANDIKAYLYPRLEPTPALSFATRYLECDAGVNITASHNPANYNGYKVYGPDGCQITTDVAAAIQQAIDDVDVFADVKTIDFEDAVAAKLIQPIDEEVISAFVDAVADHSIEPAGTTGDLRVVYTPLNGTGLECVSRILERIGVDDVYVVPEQQDPDGSFPTCPRPNPEIREALEKGIDLSKQLHADLLVATDPDADRTGVAVEYGEDFELLTGNEIGTLLFDYICRTRTERGIMPDNPVLITTIVSTDMVDRIAERYGVEVRRTLTGFKYIGDEIGRLEADGETDRFVFGFEESYGYLIGPYVRDKDAIGATMMLCQLARSCRAQGKTLMDLMWELYEEYGFYRNAQANVYYEGADGPRAMQEIMEGLRNDPPKELAALRVTGVTDYLPGIKGLPASNVLQFDIEGGNKVIVRPSGTEPKIKAYVFAHDADNSSTQLICDVLALDVRSRLER
jgi:phosphoglucomutase